jgi:hypothetical protein
MMDKEYYITIYKNELPNLHVILDDLEKIVKTSDNFEGNCFYTNKTFVRNPELLHKQANLYWLGCNGCTNICEIGFNAGHSALLLLLGNTASEINFTIFDINHHTYTSECYDYIKTKFPQVNFEFVEGDSVVMIPEWTREYRKYETFDIIHVDGGHALDIIQNDFANSVKLLKKNGVIIIDDVQKTHINDLVNLYIHSGMFEEITSMFETTFYPHRILKKCI